MATPKKPKTPPTKSDAPAGKATLDRFAVRTVNRSQIHSADYNPRIISASEQARLTAGIDALGNLQPIVWNERTGNIVGGHQRVKIFDKKHGHKEYDLQVAVVNLSESEEREANLLLNNPDAMGAWDLEKLQDMLVQKGENEIRPSAAGFDAGILFRMFGSDAVRDQVLPAGSAAEMATNMRELRSGFKEQAEEFKQNHDVDFYLVLVFKNTTERDSFIERHRLDYDVYQDPRVLDALLTEAAAKE